MESRISIVSLGVSDLEKSRSFYKQLGFTESDHSRDTIAFFELPGILLALYPEEELAKDAGFDDAPMQGSGKFRGMSLAHNVPSKEEVDKTMDFALSIGARLLVKPEDVFWGGYRGYFADPDGYPWELAYNPFWDLSNRR
jgi:catechol 2,3-dioxygenase-like lactoylglutathione lyase family enzyme